jgi:lambda repressor-like predicted transcriptional regulator
MTIFNLIKEHSATELARKTGLDESTIRRMKITHSAKSETIIKILNGLGLDIEGDPIEDVRNAIMERQYSLYVISKISGLPVSTIENFIYANSIPLWHNMVALGQTLDVKFYKDL